jgi:hypothetical protein
VNLQEVAMQKRSLKLLPLALIVPVFGFCSQAFGQDFTLASLSGTYYIPCACEGAAHNGKAIHTGGTGEVTFDGSGNVTLTQHDVYVEKNGKFTRLVADTSMPDGQTAQRSGTYSVDASGFGHIIWDGGLCNPNDDCPSFMITAANEAVDTPTATAVYLIIPNGVPNVLIHVTATKR